MHPDLGQWLIIVLIARPQRRQINFGFLLVPWYQLHGRQFQTAQEFPEPEAHQSAIQVSERMDGQQAGFGKSQGVGQALTEDTPAGFEPAGGVGGWSFVSHARSTGSPSKAMLSATCWGMACQRTRCRVATGNDCQR